MKSTSRCPAPGRHPHIIAEYDGDNPLRLAEEIDAALDKNGLGNDRRLLTSIKFFEGELRVIADCLRCAGPQSAKPPRCRFTFATPHRLKLVLHFHTDRPDARSRLNKSGHFGH
jgi:hypothetical protein